MSINMQVIPIAAVFTSMVLNDLCKILAFQDADVSMADTQIAQSDRWSHPKSVPPAA
jgi:hypothetical protein